MTCREDSACISEAARHEQLLEPRPDRHQSHRAVTLGSIVRARNAAAGREGEEAA